MIFLLFTCYEFVEAEIENEIIETNLSTGLISVLTRLMGNTDDRNSNIYSTELVLNRIFSFDNLPTDKKHIFSAILNNTICLYHIAGHRQLIEVIDKYNNLQIFYINNIFLYFNMTLLVHILQG